MKSICWILLLSALTAITTTSCNKDENSDTVYNISDSVFVRKASMSNYSQITLGQIAADSATDPSVQQFGAKMVSDHSAAQQKLQAVAAKVGIGLTVSLDQPHQQLLDSLLILKGKTFDSVYIHSQVRDNENMVTFYKDESGNGLQKDIKSYMFQVLPQIEVNLQSATIITQNF